MSNRKGEKTKIRFRNKWKDKLNLDVEKNDFNKYDLV